MTDGHKAALAVGREQGRAVRRYLEALDAQAPHRGRRPAVRTSEQIEARLAAIDGQLGRVDPLARLHLLNERIGLRAQLAFTGDGDGGVDLAELELAFVEAAGPYSERKGLSRAAWREVGIKPSVLDKAGIAR